MGGVGEKAFRLPDAEKVLLESSNPQLGDFDLAARIAQEKANPQSDIDVSAEYKKKMVVVITRRALVEAFERSRSLPEIMIESKDISFIVNGSERSVSVEPRETLLDALRDKMGLTGPKKGCNEVCVWRMYSSARRKAHLFLYDVCG